MPVNKIPVSTCTRPFWPLRQLEHFSPAYFGLVMATGIVSLGAQMQAMPAVARALFWLNALAYGVLWVLSLLRLYRHPRRFFGDIGDHVRGPGYLTLVAGTAVLGSQCVVLYGQHGLGMALWFLALGLWLVFTYAIFTAFTVKTDKPALDQGIHGGWLLATVATQSLAVLGALLAKELTQPYRLEMHFFAVCMWLCAGMLYIWTIVLIFYRYMFFRLAPDALSPAYWINMGAMAISTLAGALLIGNASPETPLLMELLPFLKGFTALYWATSTWWIPMLIALGIWRYGYKRFPMRYGPLYWAVVFPLGMYAVGTHTMAANLQLGFLVFLPPLFFYAALAAWCVAFAAGVWDICARLGRVY